MITTRYLYFYLPFLYLFKTRLPTKTQRIAWVFTYIMPFLFVTFAYKNYLSLYVSQPNKGYFVAIFICYLCLNCVYELGYMYNDFVTTRMEVNPTVRGEHEDYVYFDANSLAINAFRILLTIMLLFFSYDFCKEVTISTLISSIFILITYLVHNSNRNRLNIITYNFLVTFRYWGPFIFSNFWGINGLILWILYPLLSTLEFSSKSRFGFILLEKIFTYNHLVRFIYYFALTFFLKYFLIGFSGNHSLIFLLSVYFLIYRGAALIFFNFLI